MAGPVGQHRAAHYHAAADAMAGIDAEARAGALDVLADLVEWHLAQPRWARVEQLLASLGAAVSGRESGALREITAELELAGPIRANRIGATPAVPAPPAARDLANDLVYVLKAAPPPETSHYGGD
jgi:CATRA-associated small protein